MGAPRKDGWEQLQFTADSSAVLFHGVDAAGRRGLCRVPVSGGQPQRLGDFPSANLAGSLKMPADGHKILTISMPQIINNETWVLENFLPTAAKHQANAERRLCDANHR